MNSPDVSRRQVLTTVGATGAIALAGCSGGDGGNGDGGDGDDGGTQGGTTDGDGSGSFRIGVFENLDVTTNTGFGHQGITGLLSGFAYKNGQSSPIEIPNDDNVLAIDGDTLEYTVEGVEGVGSVDVELLIRHTGGNAREASDLASELIVEDDVDALYGASTSASLRQVNNLVMGEHEVPFFIGQGSTANVTRDAGTCRGHVFRASPNGAMLARAGALYIAEETDLQQVTIYSADTSFGNDVRNSYLDVLELNNVEVAIDEVVEPGETEWRERLLRADEESEAILYGFTGETGEFFADALAENVFDIDIKAYGQSPSRLTYEDIGLSLLDVVGDEESITPDLLDALPFGEATSRYYWHHYDNEVNNWLVDQHIETYNIVPDLFVGSAFTYASAAIQAFEETGEISSDAVIDRLSGMVVAETPKGAEAYQFQELNNQAVSPITITNWVPREEQWRDVWPALVQPGDPLSIGESDRVPGDDAALDPEGEGGPVTCDLSSS